MRDSPRRAGPGSTFECASAETARTPASQHRKPVTVTHVRRADAHRQYQPDCVDQQVVLGAQDFLTAVVPVPAVALEALDALTFGHPSTRSRIAPLADAFAGPQGEEDLLPAARDPPQAPELIDRLNGGKSCRGSCPAQLALTQSANASTISRRRCFAGRPASAATRPAPALSNRHGPDPADTRAASRSSQSSPAQGLPTRLP